MLQSPFERVFFSARSDAASDPKSQALEPDCNRALMISSPHASIPFDSPAK